jgi:hypothetical protein
VIVVENFEKASKNENRSLDIFMNKVEMNNESPKIIFEKISNPEIKSNKTAQTKEDFFFKSLNNYMHVMQLKFFITTILETKVSFCHIRQVAKWVFSCSVMLVILFYKLQCKSS